MVVIHDFRMPVPHDCMGMAVALIEIGRGKLPASFVKEAKNSEAIQCITHQAGMAVCLALVDRAGAEVVVVVYSAHLRMALAMVLHFVGRRIIAGRIYGTEENDPRREKANRSGRTGGPAAELRFGRELYPHMLALNAVWVFVKL